MSRERFPLYALAPAKINLGLFVGPVRTDSRHELVSVMQSISLADELTLERLGEGSAPDGVPEFDRISGDQIVCPGVPALEHDNLAAGALAGFRSASGWDPGALRLTILKRVPVAAGMGGGSGDAACALRLASRASGLEHDHALLLRLAGELGADVPAQVDPGRWLALGAGELLTKLPSPTEPFGVLVLPVAAELSTGAVYAEADRLGRARSQTELYELGERLRETLAAGEQLPPDELLANDLQPAALSLCPPIADALAQARAAGSDIAFVSGSGPTVLGLFTGAQGPTRARAAAHALAERLPAPIAAVPVEDVFAHAHDVPVRNNASS
jgi:4-diphosphocytidyl-2-C-methyl-D-erythritol kinase